MPCQKALIFGITKTRSCQNEDGSAKRNTERKQNIAAATRLSLFGIFFVDISLNEVSLRIKKKKNNRLARQIIKLANAHFSANNN